ncbi:MAG: hypothetical protein J1F67_05115 [Muribaculaceae bacterium]|nr:hypothetical protein [Muribaculaceae bacterium]
MGVAVGKVGQRLLRKGDEYGSLSRKHEDLGRNVEAMDAFFMDIAYQTAHYAMIKRYEALRDKGNNKPLFTLTAEEVEIAEKLFIVAKKCGQLIYEDDINKGNAEDALLGLSIVTNSNNLLSPIKEWQDEKINISG